jgi:hypothetical protein
MRSAVIKVEPALHVGLENLNQRCYSVYLHSLLPLSLFRLQRWQVMVQEQALLLLITTICMAYKNGTYVAGQDGIMKIAVVDMPVEVGRSSKRNKCKSG